ncbi:MAG: hypothetical protein ACK5O7_06290 [Holosporales bacterium]
MSRHPMKTFAFLTLCPITLSNCSPKPEFVALQPELQTHIASSEAYVQLCQDKMLADIEPSKISESNPSLLMVLVDTAIMAYRSNCAEDAMVDMQKELKNYGLQKKFQQRLEQALQAATWLHLGPIHHVAALDDETLEKASKSTKADALLTAQFSYRLDAKFNTIRGTLDVVLHPTAEKWKTVVQDTDLSRSPLMKFSLAYSEPLPFRVMSIEDNAKRWLENDAEYLKKALNSILHNLFIQLNNNLKNPHEVVDMRQTG